MGVKVCLLFLEKTVIELEELIKKVGLDPPQQSPDLSFLFPLFWEPSASLSLDSQVLKPSIQVSPDHSGLGLWFYPETPPGLFSPCCLLWRPPCSVVAWHSSLVALVSLDPHFLDSKDCRLYSVG
jgi:hypothetical protein